MFGEAREDGRVGSQETGIHAAAASD